MPSFGRLVSCPIKWEEDLFKLCQSVFMEKQMQLTSLPHLFLREVTGDDCGRAALSGLALTLGKAGRTIKYFLGGLQAKGLHFTVSTFQRRKDRGFG